MKKASRLFGFVMILIIAFSFSLVCFASDASASTFSIVKTYPAEGATNVSLDNMGVKIYLSEDLDTTKIGTKNDNCFTLVGPYTVNKETDENYSFPLKVLYSDTEKNMLMVLVDKDSSGNAISLLSNEEYVLTISGSLQDGDGNTIGSDYTVSFKTMNQTRNSTISTILMFVMFGGIMFFSMRSAKKQASKDEPQKKQEAVNPYKEAKKTGKTVEQIVEEDKKNKEKQAEKEARKAEKEKAKEEKEEEDDYIEEGHYRVKTRRKVADAGSTYSTGRKEEAEKKAAEEAERKAKEAKWAAEKKKSKKK